MRRAFAMLAPVGGMDIQVCAATEAEKIPAANATRSAIV